MAQQTITLVGNLTRDPELRFTQSGRAVCAFGIAVGTRKRDASGEWSDGPTSFYNVSAWQQLGENIASSLKKGSPVVVLGRIEQREYEVDGVKRTTYDVTADTVGVSLQFGTATYERASRSAASSAPADEEYQD